MSKPEKHSKQDKKDPPPPKLLKKREDRINAEPYLMITLLTFIFVGLFILFKTVFKSKEKNLDSVSDPAPQLPPPFKCTVAPDSPSGITVTTLTQDSILIRWNGSRTASSYIVTLTGTNGVTTYTSIFTTLTVSGLSIGGTWSITVIAVNSCGQTNEILGPTVTLCSAPPLAPTLGSICSPNCVLDLFPAQAEPADTVYYVSAMMTPTLSTPINLVTYNSTCPYSKCTFSVPASSTVVVTAINKCGTTGQTILI